MRRYFDKKNGMLRNSKNWCLIVTVLMIAGSLNPVYAAPQRTGGREAGFSYSGPHSQIVIYLLNHNQCPSWSTGPNEDGSPLNLPQFNLSNTGPIRDTYIAAATSNAYAAEAYARLGQTEQAASTVAGMIENLQQAANLCSDATYIEGGPKSVTAYITCEWLKGLGLAPPAGAAEGGGNLYFDNSEDPAVSPSPGSFPSANVPSIGNGSNSPEVNAMLNAFNGLSQQWGQVNQAKRNVEASNERQQEMRDGILDAMERMDRNNKNRAGQTQLEKFLQSRFEEDLQKISGPLMQNLEHFSDTENQADDVERFGPEPVVVEMPSAGLQPGTVPGGNGALDLNSEPIAEFREAMREFENEPVPQPAMETGAWPQAKAWFSEAIPMLVSDANVQSTAEEMLLPETKTAADIVTDYVLEEAEESENLRGWVSRNLAEMGVSNLVERGADALHSAVAPIWEKAMWGKEFGEDENLERQADIPALVRDLALEGVYKGLKKHGETLVDNMGKRLDLIFPDVPANADDRAGN